MAVNFLKATNLIIMISNVPKDNLQTKHRLDNDSVTPLIMMLLTEKHTSVFILGLT